MGLCIVKLWDLTYPGRSRAFEVTPATSSWSISLILNHPRWITFPERKERLTTKGLNASKHWKIICQLFRGCMPSITYGRGFSTGGTNFWTMVVSAGRWPYIIPSRSSKETGILKKNRGGSHHSDASKRLRRERVQSALPSEEIILIERSNCFRYELRFGIVTTNSTLKKRYAKQRGWKMPLSCLPCLPVRGAQNRYHL